MSKIGIHELPTITREVLDQVRSAGETLEIVDQGQVIARLVPVAPAAVADEQRARLDAWFTSSAAFAKQVGAAWKDDMNAVEATQEQRREL